jgi:hypothetical protein
LQRVHFILSPFVPLRAHWTSGFLFAAARVFLDGESISLLLLLPVLILLWKRRLQLHRDIVAVAAGACQLTLGECMSIGIVLYHTIPLVAKAKIKDIAFDRKGVPV